MWTFEGWMLLKRQACLDEGSGDFTGDGATVVVGFLGLFNVREYYLKGWMMATNQKGG